MLAGTLISGMAISGLVIGVLVGFFVRRARLCSFGAIESALIGHDWRRMKVFALSLGIALAGTQVLLALGWLDPLKTTYVASKIPWFSTLVGGLAFGLGMALVGTCAFGTLIRLGGGDLRSLITLLVFGAVSYAVLRGSLSSLRILVFEALVIATPQEGAATMSALLAGWWGGTASLVIVLLLGLGLMALALADRRLWRAPRLMTAGLMLGLGVIGGWLATGVFIDEFAAPVRVQSLTFVAPVARALYGAMIGGPDWFDFGVSSVFGVILGAFVASWRARDFHWEAYDDPQEMRRHLAGAVLMGFGGVLAGGCTIGQGLTAGSLTALTWPLSVGGILLGARLGILILVEGSLREVLSARLGWPLPPVRPD